MRVFSAAILCTGFLIACGTVNAQIGGYSHTELDLRFHVTSRGQRLKDGARLAAGSVAEVAVTVINRGPDDLREKVELMLTIDGGSGPEGKARPVGVVRRREEKRLAAVKVEGPGIYKLFAKINRPERTNGATIESSTARFSFSIKR